MIFIIWIFLVQFAWAHDVIPPIRVGTNGRPTIVQWPVMYDTHTPSVDEMMEWFNRMLRYRNFYPNGEYHDGSRIQTSR